MAVSVIEWGDVFASAADAIANPVNCAGVIGKGLALAFERRYPEILDPYRSACERVCSGRGARFCSPGPSAR